MKKWCERCSSGCTCQTRRCATSTRRMPYGTDTMGSYSEGAPLIGEFYQARFPSKPPHPEIECLLASPPYIAALLRLPEREGRRGWCVDLFEVEDGAIRTLRVLL